MECEGREVEGWEGVGCGGVDGRATKIPHTDTDAAD